MVSAIAGSADAQAAAGRLLKNQEDIGHALVPFYGQEAGAEVTDLLKQHILIAVDIVDAALKGDDQQFQDADHKWDENSAQIAAFLSAANPFWPEKDVQDLLSLHLNLTRREVVSRLKKEWEEDVQAFDDILTEILTLSDAIAMGIMEPVPACSPGTTTTRTRSAVPAGRTATTWRERTATAPTRARARVTRSRCSGKLLLQSGGGRRLDDLPINRDRAGGPGAG